MTIDQLRENAANCAALAEEATSEPARRRYLRMQQAWLALIETEAWLGGKTAADKLPTSLNELLKSNYGAEVHKLAVLARIA